MKGCKNNDGPKARSQQGGLPDSRTDGGNINGYLKDGKKGIVAALNRLYPERQVIASENNPEQKW